jgi:hypothetical protein
MENDYLWDKKGEDKEIEQMETALKSFRYQPISAPLLPVKVLQIEEKPKFSFFTNYFRLAAASFACLLVMIVGAGIYLNISRSKFQTVAEVSQPIANPIKVEVLNSPPDIAPIIKTPTITQPVVKKSVTSTFEPTVKPTKIAFRQTASKVRPNKAIKLTAEEKDAFDKLMLALSITGETLKEVKDKANSIEETTAIKSLR